MGKIADKDMPDDEKRQPRKVAPYKQTRYPLVAAKGKSQNRYEQQLQQGSKDEIFGVNYYKLCIVDTLYTQPTGYSIEIFDIPPEETYTLFYLMHSVQTNNRQPKFSVHSIYSFFRKVLVNLLITP